MYNASVFAIPTNHEHVQRRPLCAKNRLRILAGGMLQETTQDGSRSDNVTLGPGSMVDHFRLIRRVGRGGMGQVFLARDMLLGRKVALKVLRRTTAEGERFLHEARATARFNHPHIVTIYAVGQYDGHPYLALEYLEGRSLRDQLHDGPPGVSESLRLGIAIAEALTEAHGHGVLHRDLKPENVVIPLDGRPRVVDFGLAEVLSTVVDAETQGMLPLDSPRPGLQGTPAYMAPEQWAQEDIGPAADIWSLGVMLYELIAGRRPFEVESVRDLAALVVNKLPAPSLRGLPGIAQPFADLVQRCLEKAPNLRPSAPEVLETLRELLASARGVPAGEHGPFRGLQSFDEDHAHLFHGRDAELAAFVERLREVAVLPVVGPSGAGKSSLVQAGLVPRLRDQGPWTVVALRPGRAPFDTLASRLCLAAQTPPGVPNQFQGGTFPSPDQLAPQLIKSPQLLSLLMEWIANVRQTRVLLFVDQLEELFTLGQDDELSHSFLNAICSAADDPREPMRVVFTLREDFLGRLAGSDRVRDSLNQVMVVGPPQPTALTQTLVEPVKAMGYHYDDPTLVPEMIAAAGDGTTALSLLQFTAHLLWERRDRGRRQLTRAAYEELGGVAGAMATHADRVLDGLAPDGVRTVRDLLLRLVTPQRTRRVVPLDRMLEGLPHAAAAEQLLHRLVAARLLSVRSSQEGAAPDVELAHESLIHHWGRLARWIDRGREDLAFLEEIGQATRRWSNRGRRDDDLLHGDTLREAVVALERCSAPVPDEVRQFVQASQHRLRRRMLRRRGITALAVSLVMAVAVVFAVQKHSADEQRREARHRWAESQREAARAAAAREELLEARAKLRGSLETEDSSLARTLWWRLGRNPLVWRRDLGSVAYDVAFSPDGRLVAAACQDRQVYLFDVQTRQMRTLRGFRDQVLSVAFSPTGHQIAAGTWSGLVTIRQLDGNRVRQLRGHVAPVVRLAFSPDGQRLASVSHDGVRVWDIGRQIVGHAIPTPSRVMGTAFSPDGQSLATGSVDRRIRIWHVVPGNLAPPLVLHGHQGPVTTVGFSPDGRLLASAGTDRRVRLWRLEDTRRGSVTIDTEGTNSICFTPDGRGLAGGSDDGTIRLWRVPTRSHVAPRMIHQFLAHHGPVLGLGFSPDGKLLLSSGQDSTIGLWRVTGRVELPVVRGHDRSVQGIDFSPDDRVLASGGMDGTIRLWDTTSGSELQVLHGHAARVTGVRFSPDGRFLATASTDRTVRLWNRRRALEYRVLGSHWSPVYELAFSSDGQLLASAGNDKRVRLWSIDQGAQHEVLAGHRSGVYGLAFRPDGSILASAGRDHASAGRILASAGRDRTVHLWDTASKRLLRVLQGHSAGVNGVDFHPDGTQLASASDDGSVRLWDIATGRGVVLDRRDARAYFLAFHPGGQLVGVPYSNRTAALIPLYPGATRILRGHHGEVNRLRFSHDGRLAATSSDDGTVRLWWVRDGMPYWRGPVMLGSPPRLSTHNGWIEPGSGRPAKPAVGHLLRAAIEDRVLAGQEADDHRTICLATLDEDLEIWDRLDDRRLLQARVPGLRQALALDRGCATLGHRNLQIFSRTALLQRRPATAATWGRGRLLVASGGEILALSPVGDTLSTIPAEEGITSLGDLGDRIAMGFADGNIELTHPTSQVGLSFESLPSSPAVRIVAGPRDTMIAGHANGLLNIWHTGNGALLDHSKLHGPVIHIRVQGSRLYAATALGDHMVLDLSTLHLPYCELLRQVWREVPVVWEKRAPVVRTPPTSHACAR